MLLDDRRRKAGNGRLEVADLPVQLHARVGVRSVLAGVCSRESIPVLTHQEERKDLGRLEPVAGCLAPVLQNGSFVKHETQEVINVSTLCRNQE